MKPQLKTDLSEVREHHASVRAARARWGELDLLINQYDAELKSLTDDADDDRIDELQVRRGDALAAIAEGNAKPEAVNAIDAEIEDILKKAGHQRGERLKRYRDVSQTLAGLLRKRDEVQGKLSVLQAETPTIVRRAMKAYANELGQSYLEHAHELIRLYRDVHALAQIELVLTGDRDSRQPLFKSHRFKDFMVPSLRVPCFEHERLHDDRLGALFEGRGPHALPDELVPHMKEHLRELGILE